MNNFFNIKTDLRNFLYLGIPALILSIVCIFITYQISFKIPLEKLSLLIRLILLFSIIGFLNFFSRYIIKITKYNTIIKFFLSLSIPLITSIIIYSIINHIIFTKLYIIILLISYDSLNFAYSPNIKKNDTKKINNINQNLTNAYLTTKILFLLFFFLIFTYNIKVKYTPRLINSKKDGRVSMNLNKIYTHIIFEPQLNDSEPIKNKIDSLWIENPSFIEIETSNFSQKILNETLSIPFTIHTNGTITAHKDTSKWPEELKPEGFNIYNKLISLKFNSDPELDSELELRLDFHIHTTENIYQIQIKNFSKFAQNINMNKLFHQIFILRNIKEN